MNVTYLWDKNWVYIGYRPLQPRPDTEGEFLGPPINGCLDAPPEIPENFVAVRVEDKWVLKTNFVGKTYYTSTSDSVKVTEIGESIPDGASWDAPPSPYHTLVNGNWVLKSEDAARQKEDERIAAIPASITMSQFRQQLLKIGKLSTVKQSMDKASEEVQIKWEFDTEVQFRSSLSTYAKDICNAANLDWDNFFTNAGLIK
jgi:hypothetical protein